MIFVTVGTTHFDKLIQEVDQLAGTGEINVDVLAQIGNGRYEPRHIQSARYFPDIGAKYGEAELVVCHGGVGTVFELLGLGKRFVAVPNSDLQDDHQSDLLRALEAEGCCTVCWNLGDLGRTLKSCGAQRPYAKPGSLAADVWVYITSPKDSPGQEGTHG